MSGRLRSRVSYLSVAIACVVLGAARGAAAQDAAWDAPAGCWDRASFERAFEEALGTPLAALGPGAALRARFRDAGEAGWEVTVEVARGSAVRARTLTAPGSCADLYEGLVVVVALLVDEVAHERAPPPPIALPADDAPPAARSLTIAGALALGLTVRVDALPGLTAAPIAHGEVRPLDVLALGLTAGYFPPATSRRDDGVSVEVSAALAGLGGCLLGELADWLELGGCASTTALWIAATGSGITDGRSSSGLELDLLGEARVGVRLAGPLWLRLTAGVGVALVRARIFYEIDGVPWTLHLTSLAFPTGSALLELRIGD